MRSALVRIICVVAFGVMEMANTEPTAQAKEKPIARILSPGNDTDLPRIGVDPPCPAKGPCPRVIVRGYIPKGYWPFLAVAPLSATPRIWIQPAVLSVADDGRVLGVVYLGNEAVGAQESYQIFLFAHQSKVRFREGEILRGLPEDTIVSNAVLVRRTK